MISFPDIPGIEIHPTPAAMSGALRFDLTPPMQRPPAMQATIDRKWSELRQLNPRLHDGPILLAQVHACDWPGMSSYIWKHDKLVLFIRPDTYKTLATAAHIGMEVRAVGVQGVVTARDADGEEHILLGRRGSEVRIYQGLWENAPSGSVPSPPPGTQFIDSAHFTQALLTEGLEETGLNLAAAGISWIAMLDDAEAHSLDVVLKLQMHQAIDPRAVPCPADDTHAWEYAATAWTPLATLIAWTEQNAHAISPPTRALVRWLMKPVSTRDSA